ncbi:MAG TPA: sugar phosphate isomerase/epimerase, partial [Candidatus Aenigmarchaeota archaeon]|nr:sugar phosphate isomerase/epimerase [Candidatus Aenigmarchaeota archaeon]
MVRGLVLRPLLFYFFGVGKYTTQLVYVHINLWIQKYFFEKKENSNMIIGLSNTNLTRDKFGFEEKSFLDYFFEFCRKEGFKFIELNPRYNTVGLGFNISKLEMIKNRLKELSIESSIHSLTDFIEVCHPLKFFRKVSLEMIKTHLKIASLIEAKFLILHLGRIGRVETHVRVLKECEKLARDLGISLLIENSGKRKTKKKCEDEFQILVDNLDANIVFDVGHAWRALHNGYLSSLEEFIERFKDRIIYSHFHDNNGKRDLHLPLG